MKKPILFLISFLFISGWVAAQKPWYNKKVRDQWKQNLPPETAPEYSLFLIGDAGKYGDHYSDPVLLQVGKLLDQQGEESGVVFMGDNIYPNGMVDEEESRREYAEKALGAQCALIQEHPGQGIIVPGNHDWDEGHDHGWKYILNQQEFVDDYLKDNSVFHPRNACPGPDLVPLNDDLMLLAIDTQWWIHHESKPDFDEDCPVKSREDYARRLDEMLWQNRDKNIVVVGHHPVFSYGEHGGHFSWKTHVFPLTYGIDGAYLPIPVLGSLHPVIRQVWGHEQDMAHPSYKSLKDSLHQIFNKYPNLIYAAGHEHTLQYFPDGEQHYVVSGAGAKSNYVGRGPKAEFTSRQNGFARLDYYEDGAVWLTFFEATMESTDLLYRRKLYVATPAQNPERAVAASGKRKIVAPDETIRRSTGGRDLFLGTNYRDLWNQEVEAKVYDLVNPENEVADLQRIGDGETEILRFQGAAAPGEPVQTLQLRKLAKRAVYEHPSSMQEEIPGPLVRDARSGIHPYGALIASKLAKMAGIECPEVSLRVVADQPDLAPFSQFGDQLCVLEEMGNWESGEVLTTTELLQQGREGEKWAVDDELVLKMRLFNVLVGDWDRHDGQFAWRRSPKGDRDFIFEPILLDQDMAFSEFEGLIPAIGQGQYGARELRGLQPSRNPLKSTNYRARYFDRTFLIDLDETELKRTLEELRNSLSGEKVEETIREALPVEIDDREVEWLVGIMEYRMEYLEEWFEEYLEDLQDLPTMTGGEFEGYELHSPELPAPDRVSAKVNVARPLIDFGYDVDNGWKVGAGGEIIKYGFQPDPFQFRHRFSLHSQTGTGAGSIKYEGIFPKIGPLHLMAKANITAPFGVRNYFRMGNESVIQAEKTIDYFRFRYNQSQIGGGIWMANSSQKASFGLLAELEWQNAVPKRATLLDSLIFVGREDSSLLVETFYLGPTVFAAIDSRDSKRFPTRGLFLRGQAFWKTALNNSFNSFAGGKWEFGLFYTPNFGRPLQTTLAIRAGGNHVFGDFPLLNAPNIGGPDLLSGYRMNRFYGNSVVYQNSEIRIRLGKSPFAILPGQFGLLGHHDIGRVWSEGESSKKWHQGYGGGVYFAPYDAVVIQGNWSFSEEGNFPSLRFGFRF